MRELRCSSALGMAALCRQLKVNNSTSARVKQKE